MLSSTGWVFAPSLLAAPCLDPRLLTIAAELAPSPPRFQDLARRRGFESFVATHRVSA